MAIKRKQKTRARNNGWVTQAWEATLELAQDRRQELSGFLWLMGGLAVLAALVPREPNLLGVAGTHLFRLCFGFLGLSCVLVPAGMLFVGVHGIQKKEIHAPSIKALGWSLICLSVVCLLNLTFGERVKGGVADGLYWGGLLGRVAGNAMLNVLAPFGTVIACVAFLAVAMYLLEQEGLVKGVILGAYERAKIGYQGWQVRREMRALAKAAQSENADDTETHEAVAEEAPRANRRARSQAIDETSVIEEAEGSDEGPQRLATPVEKSAAIDAFLKTRSKVKVSQAGPRVNTSASTEAITAEADEERTSKLENYVLPSVELLKPGGAAVAAPKDYEAVSANLEKVLANFDLAAKVVEVCAGPTVTRYEIALGPGVKMSRVVSLADDIALGAKASSVRIEGPIPGKGTLGIEIPNAKPSPVSMRELVDTEEFQKSAHKLIFAVGKDIGGSMIFANLAEMPHLMVAGSTGSGKSVCLNVIITSILLRAAPDEVKMLMIDPKRVELTPYEGIPHLIRRVVTDPKEATAALRIVVLEMEDRYRRLAAAGMRKIDDYNEWVAERDRDREASPELTPEELAAIPKETYKHARLPYIVVIVDELADLMMVSANEVESSIARLTQMARGVGIHMVIATQRPSVDVITGVIKANLPSRIAFQVSSKVDSRTILDGNGAEALLGKGDMLYNPFNVSKPVRVQGCFVSGTEVAKVVAHVSRQAEAVFDPRFENLAEPSTGGSDKAGNFSDVDEELYNQALRVVLQAGQGSTSVLQRKLGMGFGKAARLIDKMEAEGILGPAVHNKPRKLLVDPTSYSDQPENIAGSLE